MIKSIKLVSLIFVLLITQMIQIPPLLADNESEELIHLVVLADISGSLLTTDTKELQQLINKIPSFLDNDKLNRSKLSIIAFSSEAVQICETKEVKELKTTDGSKFFRDCTSKIQSTRNDNPEKNNRVQGVGNDTNQIKAFERGLEAISNDTDNYVPVFLLLTDGELDPVNTGAASSEADSEYERGFKNIAPEMKKNSVQLFIFGFGNAKASNLNEWLGFTAERRACQEEAPDRVYLNEENRTVSRLLASINIAMKQVTCGESKEIILLEPGEPYVFYVSDLVESLEMKVNLNGVDGVQPVISNSNGDVLVENNFDEECSDPYIFCYKVQDPLKGDWSATTEVFNQSTATGNSIIALEKTFYGTFKIKSQCVPNTLKDGIDQCTLELLSSRNNASDLNLAINKIVFNARFNNSNIEQLIEFSNNQLILDAFVGESFKPGLNELILQPTADGFDINEQFKWLQYAPSVQWSYEVISTTTTTVEVLETVETDNESSFPWWLLIALVILLLIVFYLTSRKRNLPFGDIEYFNNIGQRINKINQGEYIREAYYDITFTDETIEIKPSDNKNDANLILSSVESYGIELFTNRERPSSEVKLTFIDKSESNVTIHEIGYPDTEIKIQDKYTIKFIADEDLEQYNLDDEDTSLDDFDFED